MPISTIGSDGLASSAVTQAKVASGAIDSTQLATAVTPIGAGQTWQSVTGSRSLLTNYTNSTGRPIQVYIVCSAGSSNGATLTIAGNTPAQVYTNVAGGRVALFCVIPNSTVYQLGDSGATIQSWWELR
jgi:hypothetical protein